MEQVWALLGEGLKPDAADPDAAGGESDQGSVERPLDLDGGLEQEELDYYSDSDSDCDPDCDSDYGSDYNLDYGSDCDLEEEGSVEELVESDDGLAQGLDPESKASLSKELRLTERLFQLSCAFWTDMSTTGIASHLPLVYFSGVLGIRREGLAFRTAYEYTTYPAGLVYVGRLLMLELALPQRAYETLGWPDCSACPDQLRRLQLVRRKYLCRGGGHPMERLLALLYQGRTIAKKEGARANIAWLANGQVLQLCLGPLQRQCQIDMS